MWRALGFMADKFDYLYPEAKNHRGLNVYTIIYNFINLNTHKPVSGRSTECTGQSSCRYTVTTVSDKSIFHWNIAWYCVIINRVKILFQKQMLSHLTFDFPNQRMFSEPNTKKLGNTIFTICFRANKKPSQKPTRCLEICNYVYFVTFIMYKLLSFIKYLFVFYIQIFLG